MRFRFPLVLSLALAAAAVCGAAERSPQYRPATHAAQDSGRVIVKFKDDARAQAQSALAGAATSPQVTAERVYALGQRLGMRLSALRRVGSTMQLVEAQGWSAAALADALAADDSVEWAAVDERRRAAKAPNDPLYPDGISGTPSVGQWYLRKPAGDVRASIDIEAAWQQSTGSRDIVVAMLDTGVRLSHPDLAGKLLPGRDFITEPRVANDGGGRDADPSDPGDWITDAENNASGGLFEDCGVQGSSWHGTQTAGLVGAATNNGIGMAGAGRNIRVLPVRVLGKCGGYDSDILDAMRWAAGLPVDGAPDNPNPARVINMSLGSAGVCSQAYRTVVQQLLARRVVIVVSAGNDGKAVSTPANCPGVIAVAGLRHIGTKVGYSNLGNQVTIAAPAGNCVNDTGECLYPLISTTDSGTRRPVGASYTNGFNSSFGTSFSAPLVSATAALMLSVDPGLTPTDVKSMLQRSATAFPTTGADQGIPQCRAPSSVAQDDECYCTRTTCGAGMLNAGAAVKSVNSFIARITARPTGNVAPGATVTFSAADTQLLPGRSVAAYRWTLTEGSEIARITSATNAETATVVASAAGSYTVQLVVTDDEEASARSTHVVTVVSATTSPSDSDDSDGGGAFGLEAAALILLALASLRAARLRHARVRPVR